MKCLPVTVSAAEDADGEETQGGGPGSPPTIVGGLWAGTRSAPRWQWWYRTHPPRQETLETWVPSLGWEDPLEKRMAIHSSILVWKIPWTEKPGGLQSTGSQRVGRD